jgi:hypothetical protein
MGAIIQQTAKASSAAESTSHHHKASRIPISTFIVFASAAVENLSGERIVGAIKVNNHDAEFFSRFVRLISRVNVRSGAYVWSDMCMQHPYERFPSTFNVMRRLPSARGR